MPKTDPAEVTKLRNDKDELGKQLSNCKEKLEGEESKSHKLDHKVKELRNNITDLSAELTSVRSNLAMTQKEADKVPELARKTVESTKKVENLDT